MAEIGQQLQELKLANSQLVSALGKTKERRGRSPFRGKSHIEVDLHLGTVTEEINHRTVIEEVNHPTGHHTIPTDPTGLTSHPTHHPTDQSKILGWLLKM